MRSQRIACTLALVAVAAGCGGSSDGPRRMRAVQPVPPPEVKLTCGTSTTLDCTHPTMLRADGHLTNFSYPEALGATSWCNEGGFHGSTFAYNGVTGNTAAMTIDELDEGVTLNVMVASGSYGGGGLAFGSCLDASAFTGIQFSVALIGGSLTGCNYEFQLQTSEQHPSAECDQSTTSCYNFPAARNLPAPSTDLANPTLVQIPFSSFANVMMPAPPQLVGMQWQVSSSGGACNVELRIDDVDFYPPMSPPDADGGTGSDAAND
jgi:hypothetical protein